jgi:hypothetical protein
MIWPILIAIAACVIGCVVNRVQYKWPRYGGHDERRGFFQRGRVMKS